MRKPATVLFVEDEPSHADLLEACSEGNEIRPVQFLVERTLKKAINTVRLGSFESHA